MNNIDLCRYIEDYLTILENNYRYANSKKISFEEVFEMIKDLSKMLNKLNDTKKVGNYCIKRYIPLLNLLLKIDTNPNHNVYHNQYITEAYKFASRISLEHYMIYREWDEPEEEKFFEPRFNIMEGYVHYLQEIETNPNFRIFTCLLE